MTENVHSHGGNPGGHPGGHPGRAGGHPGGHPMPKIERDPRDHEVDFEEVNQRNNFAMYAVFQTGAPLPTDASQRQELVAEVNAKLTEYDLTLRGWYDVAAFRADADLMLWVLGEDIDAIQDCYHEILGSRLGGYLVPIWTNISRHMTAEFNAPHLPACFDGWAPRKYMAVYPFTRSLEWYYLPSQRRRAMLAEHGMNGRDYLDVGVSTLATFALSDYEWTVALEHDDIKRVMGVLRVQRNCEARLHVKIDTPFYTGRRMELAEWIEKQPTEAIL